LFLADVSGHGVPAALIVSMVNIALATQVEAADQPDILMTNLNKILIGHCENRFITSIYVLIDTLNMKLKTSNAGHPPLLIYRKPENTFLTLKPQGSMQGVFEHFTYGFEEVDLKTGDRIILYSDGILEAGSSSGADYGQEQFKNLIELCANLKPDEFVNELQQDITRFTGEAFNKDDDFTIVVWDIL